MPQKNRYPLLIKVSYNGSSFAGWQQQKNGESVSQQIEKAWQTVLQDREVSVQGASRTDAGVHALGQAAIVSIKMKDYQQIIEHMKNYSAGAWPAKHPQRIMRSVNALLKPNVRLRKLIDPNQSEFAVRRSSHGKGYFYALALSEQAQIFFPYFWPLNSLLPGLRPQHLCFMLKKILPVFQGTHDFSAFAKQSSIGGKNPERTLSSLRVQCKGDFILLFFRGPGFLHHQIRLMVGTVINELHLQLKQYSYLNGPIARTAIKNHFLQDMAAQVRQEIHKALQRPKQHKPGFCAPAQGLFLHHVYYPYHRHKRFRLLWPR